MLSKALIFSFILLTALDVAAIIIILLVRYFGVKKNKTKKPEEIEEIELKLVRIQQSTRTLVPYLLSSHEKLRMRFKWYYNWHLKSYAKRVHVGILFGYLLLLALYYDYTYALAIAAIQSLVVLIDLIVKVFIPKTVTEDIHIHQKVQELNKQELEEKLAKIQASTKTSFTPLIPWHEKLRIRFQWYYNWHLNPYATRIHLATLAMFFISATTGVIYGIWQHPSSPVEAAMNCSSVQDGDWQTASTWTNCGGSYPQASTSNASIGTGHDITLSGTATAGTITIIGSLTTNNNTVNSTGISISAGGALVAGSSSIYCTGNFSNEETFTQGTSTVYMSGTSTQSISGGSAITFNNLTISNTTAAVSTSVSFAVGGTFTIDSGAIFTPAAANVISGAGTLTGSGTAQVSRTASTADFSSQYTITNKTYTNLIVEYTAASAQTVSAVSYGHLKISTTSSAVATLANNTTLTGNLTISSGGTLSTSASNYNLTIGGNWTCAGTFTPGTGTVTFNAGATGKTITSGGQSFNHITFNNSSGGWTLQDTMVANNFTVTLGAPNIADVQVTVNGDLSLGAGQFAQNDTGSNYVILAGSSKNITMTLDTYNVRRLKVTGTYTSTNHFKFGKVYNSTFGKLIVDGGTLTVNAAYALYGYLNGSDSFSVINSGDIQGTANWYLYLDENTTIPSFTATASGSVLLYSGNGTTLSYTLGGHVSLVNKTLTNYYTATFNTSTYNLSVQHLALGYSTTSPFHVNLGSGTHTISGNIIRTTGSTIATNTLNLNSSTISVGGNINFTGITVTPGTSTITMNASDTDNTITSASQSFNHLTFNNASGGWAFQDTAVTNNFTVTNGAPNLADYQLTINGNISITGGQFAQNDTGSNYVILAGSGKTSATTVDTYNPRRLKITGTYTANGTMKIGKYLNSPYGQLVIDGGTITINAPNVLYFYVYPTNAISIINSGDILGNAQWYFYATADVTLPGFTANATGYFYLYAGNSVNNVYTLSGNLIVPNKEIANYYTSSLESGIYNISATNLAMGNTTYPFHVNLGSGTHTFTGYLVRGGTVTTSTLNFGSSTVSVAGAFNLSNIVVTAGTAEIILNGSANQTVTSDGESIYKLTVTNASASPGVTFADSLTVTNMFKCITPSATLTFTVGTTATLADINLNGGAVGTRITIRSTTSSQVSWVVGTASQTDVSYVSVSYNNADSGETIDASNGTNLNGGNNINWNFGNVAPNAPTSLAQKKTDDTVLATGDWASATSIKFTATVSDTNNPDTLYLCVEKDALATSFSDTEDLCGSGVAYSGSPVTASVTITGITVDTEYHWQARVKDSGGLYSSSWTSYGGNLESARDFGLDTSAPTSGAVNDGTGSDAEFNTGSLTSLSANWSFNSNVSGINQYQYAVRRTYDGYYWNTGGGGSWQSGEIWYSNTTNTSITVNSMNLQTNVTYYFSVKATDNAGNITDPVNSNGQQVLPTIAFVIQSTSIVFDNLNNTNGWTDTQTNVVTTSTNAYGGYAIKGYITQNMTSTSYPSKTISNYTGTWATPTAWGEGVYGFGYTSYDTNVAGSNRFNGGNNYAGFATNGNGDTVADHSDIVNGSTGPVTNEQFTVQYKVAVGPTQSASDYATTIIYVATANY